MRNVAIPLEDELLSHIDELARREERTRPAEIRYLLRQAITAKDSTAGPEPNNSTPPLQAK